MERKRAFQMKQRFERCKTPSGSVPISVIMGFDYPLGFSNTFLTAEQESFEWFENIWDRNVLVTVVSVRQRGEWAGGGKVVLLLLCERPGGARRLQEQHHSARELQLQSQHRLHEQTHAGQTGPASHLLRLALISLTGQNIHSEDLSGQGSHWGEIWQWHTEVHQRYISYSQPANQYRQRLSSSFLPRGKLSSQLTYLLLTDHIEKLKLVKTGTFLAKNNIIFGISIKICFIYLLAGLGWKILRRNDFSFGPLCLTPEIVKPWCTG